MWTDTDGLHAVTRNSLNIVCVIRRANILFIVSTAFDFSVDVRKGPKLIEDLELEGRVVTEVNEVSTTGLPAEPPVDE